MQILVKNIPVPTLGIAGVLLLIGLLGMFPLPPCAADEKDPLAEETTLETITVTAEKREENVQKVTSSITVLSDITIEDTQIESTKDIGRYVPNLSISYSGSRDYFTGIQLRGLSNTSFGDPAVALYIDDVSYADVYAFDCALFDIERVEVLKGPQGTLYGKNAEGGVINIVTKSAGNDFEGKVGIEAGDYNKWGVNALINTPVLKDKLFLRLSALKSARDGYIENVYTGSDVDNQDTTAANAGLLFTPADRLSFNLTFRIHEYDDDGGYPAAPLEKSQYMAATGLAGLDDFQISYNFPGESSSKNNTTSLRIKNERDYFDLVSVTAYRNMHNEGTLDGDYSLNELYVGFCDVQSESITQEFRVQSKDSEKSFKWLTGVYYGYDEKDYATGYMYDTVYADMMSVPLYSAETHSATIASEDMSVFGQSTIRFFNDALGLTAGLRYERSKRTLDHQHTFMGTPAADPINGLEETFSEWLPKFSVDFRINNNIMTYAGVARGYKAGGFAYAVDDPEKAAFDPEVSTSFELGLKTEFPDLGLRVNLAGFYTMVDDYQDRVQYDFTTIVQANATETNIYGFELEVFYALTDTLSLNGFIGYTHAEYDEYIDPMTGVDYQGNSAVNIPEYNAGLFLEYRNPSGIFARLEMQNTGSCYFDRANTHKQSAYTLYNMKMGYERDKWDIYLYVKNLSDEQYFLEAYDDPSIGWVGTIGNPRTIGLALNYRF